MVVAYVIVGLIGALITVPVLWQLYGPLAALLGAPLGASFLALAVALAVALQSDRRSHDKGGDES